MIIMSLMAIVNFYIFNINTVSNFIWIFIIFGIDFIHVYSILLKKYLSRKSMLKYGQLIFIIPFISWVSGVSLYSFDPMLFWRIIAYAVILHIICQQYSLLVNYSRHEKKLYRLSNVQNDIKFLLNIQNYSKKLPNNDSSRRRIMLPKSLAFLDKILIISAMIYPLIYWHLNKSGFLWQNYSYLNLDILSHFITSFCISLLFLYSIKEMYFIIYLKIYNLPRNLMLISTIITWFAGIIYFDNDFTFMACIVIAHKIQNIALSSLNGNKIYQTGHFLSYYGQKFLQKKYIIIFLSVVSVLLYLFFYIKNFIITYGYQAIFIGKNSLSQNGYDVKALTCIVPLLMVPQITHYIFDSFGDKPHNKYDE